jgi:NAD(P)-dependent dehydrogenase (short-subunit alcohol dehydrogenase family)
MSMPSTHPVVIVTGASRGLGQAAALILAANRVQAVLVARSAETLQAVKETIDRMGAVSRTLIADVALEDDCRRVVADTLAYHGRLDALINNAATLAPLSRVAQSASDQWQQALAVNLLGPYHLTRLAIPALRGCKGRIVNVVSGAALQPVVGWSAYCTAKAALLHFTRVVAAEEPRLTCVALRPGVIDTAMQTMIRQNGAAAMETEKVAYFKQLNAQTRLEPAHVPARALAWLALHAPPDWSGRLIDYDDPELAASARRLGAPS